MIIKAMKLKFLLTILFFSFSAYAEPIKDSDAIKAIVGEAAGEGYKGQLAVACAIRNRGNLNGVYGLNSKMVNKQPVWVWKIANKAWQDSKSKDITNGAQFWESTDFPRPSWSKNMQITFKYKKHIFYKK